MYAVCFALVFPWWIVVHKSSSGCERRSPAHSADRMFCLQGSANRKTPGLKGGEGVEREKMCFWTLPCFRSWLGLCFETVRQAVEEAAKKKCKTNTQSISSFIIKENLKLWAENGDVIDVIQEPRSGTKCPRRHVPGLCLTVQSTKGIVWFSRNKKENVTHYFSTTWQRTNVYNAVNSMEGECWLMLENDINKNHFNIWKGYGVLWMSRHPTHLHLQCNLFMD